MREVAISYHKEVMESKHKVIVVRAARRTGKTSLLVDWAASKTGRTLILVSNRTHATFVREALVRKLGDAVHRHASNHVSTHDGREYWIMSALSDDRQTCGMRVNNVAVDEFGFIDKEWMITINCLKAQGEGDLLFVGSTIREGSISDYFEMYGPFVHYINYTGMDALNDRLFQADFLTKMRDMLKEEMFEEEFGPWGGFWGESNNAGFVHLLRK